MSKKANATAQVLEYGVAVGDRYALLNPERWGAGLGGTVERVYVDERGIVCVNIRWDDEAPHGAARAYVIDTVNTYFYRLPPKPEDR